jgi:hypothetical protein
MPMIIFLGVVGVLSWLLAALSLAASMLNKLGGIQAVAAGVYGTMGVVSFLGCSVLNHLRKLSQGEFTDNDVRMQRAKQCYQCGELVKTSVLRCRHCGEQFHRIDKQQAA